ncbi:MAG: flagellar hook-length control protein FliK [Rhodobacteraceae bacterium]|nr:flagellar hook-length control protein FliK [Paracoccaceae bacterium]
MENSAPVLPDSPATSAAAATLLEVKTKATLQANAETPDDQAALSALSRHSEVEGTISKRELAGPPVSIAQQRAVVVQVAQAVNGAEGSVEISLDPAELGKIRLTLRATDTGMNVQVVAERSHAIDLLRRNIGQLEAEFRELGFSDIGFEFSQQNNGSALSDQAGSEDWWMETPDASTAPIVNVIPARRVANGIGGLDLRL